MSVFSYDLGEESIGYCVRDGYTVQEMGIDLVDANHASITERGLSGRRRAIRTRLAHKMRETWFRWFWTEKLGLTDLREGDTRWGKEFSKDGMLYNGASIRVAILQGLTNPNGTPLNDWQLFKGFWSLIQRRGYDAGVAWGEKEAKEGDDQKLVEDYKKKLTESQLDDNFHLPAYLETFRLGVWHPISPKMIESTLGASPLKVRNDKSSAPREMVVAELKALVEALKVLRPQNSAVQELTFETLAYGDAQMAYATYFAGRKNTPFQIKPFQKLRGSFRPYKTRINGEWFPLEWEGVLSQKTPRFDNRILSDCCLIPRFHVCRNMKKDGSWKGVVVHQAKALMMLRNLRFMDMKKQQARGLTPDELNLVWDTFLAYEKESLSSSWLNKTLPKLIEGAFHFKDNKVARNQYKQFDDWTPNDSGRSRFSRPAATLLRDCLLSGLSPQAYVDDLLAKGYYPNPDGEFKPLQAETPEGKRKGLTPQDLQDFAKRLGGDSWDNLHIADNRDSFDDWNQAKREAYIEKVLIGTCMNNVVRNRLSCFMACLKIKWRRMVRLIMWCWSLCVGICPSRKAKRKKTTTTPF
jgi:CRISPR-associated endonuclease Csn1